MFLGKRCPISLLLYLMTTVVAHQQIGFAQPEEGATNSASSPPIQPQQDWILNNQSKALEASTKALGPTKPLQPDSTSASLVTIHNAPIPFLANSIEDEFVWHVSTKTIEFEGIGDRAKEGLADRTWDIYLHAKDGFLIRIVSRIASGGSVINEISKREVVEKQIASVNDERYVGFPKESPNIGFGEALEAVRAKGIGSLERAFEIEGLCVLQQEIGIEPRSVWIVILRGPIPDLHSAGAPNGYVRHIIDAQTGEWLRGSVRRGPRPLDQTDNLRGPAP